MVVYGLMWGFQVVTGDFRWLRGISGRTEPAPKAPEGLAMIQC